MTEPITFVVLSTGLENFKDIRRALTAEDRVKLLAGGNDAEQLYEEIVRLKPDAAIIALGLVLLSLWLVITARRALARFIDRVKPPRQPLA